MRKVIFTLILALGITAAVFGQTTESITLKAGKNARARHSGLTLRFVEVTEDSRCPAGLACVWAGNARVKIQVVNRGGGTKTLEANTTMGPKGDQFDGWAIELVSLTPRPTKKGKPGAKSYIAAFTITRLQR